MRSFALGSGSAGNCFYFETEKKRVLVDIGFSFSKICERLGEKSIDIKEIDAVFITHEHSDHIRGFEVAFKNLNCDFFMSKGTFEALKIDKSDKIKFVKNHDVLVLDDLKVFVIEKSHDAKEALSFAFENCGEKHGVFTDLGKVNDEILHILKSLDVVYFEINYCEDILEKKRGEFNINYVNRLVSDIGHLGVRQSCDAIRDFCFNGQKIILSHISENTNSYENSYLKVLDVIEEKGVECEVLVSFQNCASNFITK